MSFNDAIKALDDMMNIDMDPTKALDNDNKKIHLRFVKTGPRAITIVEGMDEDLDLIRIANAMKRKFKCAASIQTDKGGREVIQLQGNHLANVKTWLIDQKILGKQEADTRIIIHGI